MIELRNNGPEAEQPRRTRRRKSRHRSVYLPLLRGADAGFAATCSTLPSRGW